MQGKLIGRLKKAGLTRSRLRWIAQRPITEQWFNQPVFNSQQRRAIAISGDPVRYGTLMLAFEQIARDGVPGALAEAGVWKGRLSKFIREQVPDRTLYLFDTFEGFDPRDSDSNADSRFRDTSVNAVLEHIGTSRNIVVRKGYFPDIALGLEDERFAFAMLDFDKYEPTLAGLNFFYPRVSSGGFIFVHDYTSPESNWACSRALNEFLADKPEYPILIPDAWGTAFFRKF